MSQGKVEVFLKVQDFDQINEVICHIDLQWYYDPGCWRTANGDGWPESFDYDYIIIEYCDENEHKIDKPDWVTIAHIDKAVDEFAKDIDIYI